LPLGIERRNAVDVQNISRLGAGFRLIDFKSSCLIRANRRQSIIELERKLKHSFKEYRTESSLANTEIFRKEAFPLMLEVIKTLQQEGTTGIRGNTLKPNHFIKRRFGSSKKLLGQNIPTPP
jgi:hypothetical protein